MILTPIEKRKGDSYSLVCFTKNIKALAKIISAADVPLCSAIASSSNMMFSFDGKFNISPQIEKEGC